VGGLTDGTSYTFTVHASNAGGDSAESAASANAVIPAAVPTINFAAPAPYTFGTTPALVATTSPVGGIVTFGSSTTGVCTVAGTAVTLVTAGTCTINADEAATSAHPAAITVTHNITVNAVQANPPTNLVATAGSNAATLTFTPPTFTGGDPITNYTVTLNPATTAPQTCGSSGCSVTLVNGTLYTLSVKTNTAAGASASAASTTVRPAGIAQSITFSPAATQPFGSTPTLTASASSGLGVSFTTATPSVCTVTSAGQLAFLGIGTCTINADQSGDATRQSAPTNTKSFTVVAAAPTVTVTSSGSPSVTGQPLSFTATLTNPATTIGTIQWSVNSVNVGSPVALGAATTTFTPSPALAVGSYVVKAVYNPLGTDPNHTAATSNSLTQVVGKAATTTSVAVSGDTLTATVAPVAPGAGSPTGTVAFTVNGLAAGSATLGAGGIATLTGTGVGSHSVTATYSGDGNFLTSSGHRSAVGPTVVAHVSSAHPKHNGWYRSTVHVSFTCTANTAPLSAGCPATRTLSTNGRGKTVTVTVAQTDGGTTTVAVGPINIDGTAPRLTVTRHANNVKCHASDSLSHGATCSVHRTRTIHNGVHTLHWTATAHDRAGNTKKKSGHFSY
jgi:hypothetical protein